MSDGAGLVGLALGIGLVRLIGFGDAERRSSRRLRDLDDASRLDHDGVEVAGVADLDAPHRWLDHLEVAVLVLERLGGGGRVDEDRARRRDRPT